MRNNRDTNPLLQIYIRYGLLNASASRNRA